MNQVNQALSSLDLQSILGKVAENKAAKLQQITGKPQVVQLQQVVPVSKQDPIENWESEGGRDLDALIPHRFLPTVRLDVIPHKPVPVVDILSTEQRAAVDYFKSGKSGCMVGKAGTGKTFTVVKYASELVEEHKAIPMHDIDGHKWLKRGSFGIVCCAFTNRATNNISKNFDLFATQINFMTIHKLLEFIREEFQVIDSGTKELKTSWRFMPSRNIERKLPSGLHTIVIEEAGMVSLDLYRQLIAACPRHVQFIFLGDLQQLPPIYGDGILGYKLNELPVFELTKIYRQAAENPIIKLAWDTASGRNLTKEVLEEEFLKNKTLSAPIRITFFEKKIAFDYAVVTMGNFFCQLLDRGVFNPDSDIILVPYNKQLGSVALNAAIAQHVSNKSGRETYEIIAGFQKHYYAVGDKVLFNKKEGYITKITRNGRYVGKSPLPPSIDMHRDGVYHAKDSSGAMISPEKMTDEELDRYSLALLNSEAEDIQNQASHVVHVDLTTEQLEDGSTATEVSTRGEYGNLELAYAITVHKAQGCEWKKVFLLLHNSHHMANRELLYTAITRASQQLFIMCERDSFAKIIPRQRIPGTSLQEKILWFKTKIEEMQRKVELAKKQNKVVMINEDNEE